MARVVSSQGQGGPQSIAVGMTHPIDCRSCRYCRLNPLRDALLEIAWTLAVEAWGPTHALAVLEKLPNPRSRKG